jgi:Subtilase family
MVERRGMQTVPPNRVSAAAGSRDLIPQGAATLDAALRAAPQENGLSATVQPPGNAALLDLVGLMPLMRLSQGARDVVIALLDGPVATSHPDLADESITTVHGRESCTDSTTAVCAHGTFVAGVLAAKRGAPAPAICPGCTILVYPIFHEGHHGDWRPSATVAELAEGVTEAVAAGAQLINVSAAVTGTSAKGERELQWALNQASDRGAVVVAAAGNEAEMKGSVLTRHPWVVPVAACTARGWPLASNNLSNSIGRRGLAAPGEAVVSLSPLTRSAVSGGTSVAAPFVTGAIALLLSEFPDVPAGAVRWAATHATTVRRRSIVPPLLNAWAAYAAVTTVLQQKGTTHGLLAAVISAIVCRSWIDAQARTIGVLALTGRVPVLAWATREVTCAPHVSDRFVAGVPTTVYRPGGGSRWPALVFLNGVTAPGRHHPDVERLAHALARIGVLVLVPDPPGLAEGEITKRTLTATRTAQPIRAKTRDGTWRSAHSRSSTAATLSANWPQVSRYAGGLLAGAIARR